MGKLGITCFRLNMAVAALLHVSFLLLVELKGYFRNIFMARQKYKTTSKKTGNPLRTRLRPCMLLLSLHSIGQFRSHKQTQKSKDKEIHSTP